MHLSKNTYIHVRLLIYLRGVARHLNDRMIVGAERYLSAWNEAHWFKIPENRLCIMHASTLVQGGLSMTMGDQF